MSFKSKMMKTLEYYCANGTHLIFNKYTIDTSRVIRNKKTRKKLSYSKNKEGYNTCSVIDDEGSRCTIPVCRAVAVTAFRDGKIIVRYGRTWKPGP